MRRESCSVPLICTISRFTNCIPDRGRNCGLHPVCSDPAPYERRSDRSGSLQEPTCNRSDRSECFVGPTLSRSTRSRGVDRARADRLHTLTLTQGWHSVGTEPGIDREPDWKYLSPVKVGLGMPRQRELTDRGRSDEEMKAVRIGLRVKPNRDKVGTTGEPTDFPAFNM